MNLLSGIKIVHNLAMTLFGARRAIDQSSGANLGISRREIGNQSRNQHLPARGGERCPRRPRIGAVDRDLLPRGGDTGGELTGKVEKKTLGSAILVSLLEAVFVGAHASEE